MDKKMAGPQLITHRMLSVSRGAILIKTACETTVKFVMTFLIGMRKCIPLFVVDHL
jgi:hypothetical protein